MQPREGALKLFATAFVLALVAYVVLFAFIEKRRPRNGPWVVSFSRESNAPAMLRISQHLLGLTNVLAIAVTNAFTTNIEETIRFETPRSVPFDVPFGRCVFLDTTFLPGTVTLQIAGHEIELLPRVLVIDHREHTWNATSPIQLGPAAVSP